MKLTRCKRVTEHVQVTVHHFQLSAKVPLQQEVSVPRCSVFRGKDKAFRPAADVNTQRVHDLRRYRNFSNCVLCLRSLNLAAPYGLTNANEFLERVHIYTRKTAPSERSSYFLQMSSVDGWAASFLCERMDYITLPPSKKRNYAPQFSELRVQLPAYRMNLFPTTLLRGR